MGAGTFSRDRALVVKVGGSLYNHVPELVTILQSSPVPLLIIPGGGRFADDVRAAQLPDDDAHWAAINAMDRFGRYIASFRCEATDRLAIPERTSVLLPYRCMREKDPLPHTWDVTSDTIAAWIAGSLGLDLLVLKSVDGIRNSNSLVSTISQPIETEDVDPFFIPYVLQNRIRTVIINGSLPNIVAGFLQGKQVIGTRIGTTF